MRGGVRAIGAANVLGQVFLHRLAVMLGWVLARRVAGMLGCGLARRLAWYG
jgi:hypothetical protein